MFLSVTFNIPSIFRYSTMILQGLLKVFQNYLNNSKGKVHVNGDWSNEVRRSNGSTAGLTIGPSLVFITNLTICRLLYFIC